MNIIGISGSLRAGSFNTALLRAIQEVAPEDVQVEMASIRGIPLYDADDEEKLGLPDVVKALKEQLATSDALLLATPEYNSSIPGVFKNAIDWLSRPGADIPRVFGNRAVAIVGATPGRGGTLLAQTAWLPVLRTLGMRPWFGPRVTVSGANRVFNDEGHLVDDELRSQLTRFVEGFAAFVRS